MIWSSESAHLARPLSQWALLDPGFGVVRQGPTVNLHVAPAARPPAQPEIFCELCVIHSTGGQDCICRKELAFLVNPEVLVQVVWRLINLFPI